MKKDYNCRDHTPFNHLMRNRSQYKPFFVDEQELVNEHAHPDSQYEQGNTEMERFPERYAALRGVTDPNEQRLIRAKLRSQGIY